MPTIPKAGFARLEDDSTDSVSNSRAYIPSPSDRSDNETKGRVYQPRITSEYTKKFCANCNL